jgi:[ribosomal protein S5]-alanine N-acetyltransferase
LKILTPDDVGNKYVSWMNDAEVLQYMESRGKAYTLGELQDYVRTMNDGSNNFMFGIYLKENDEHIGNIKIGNINHMHKFGDIGLIIGNKKVWGKGYALEAINLATGYAFNELKLNKIIAGIYANNIGSIRVFKKAGYQEAGTYKEQRLYDGVYVDEIMVEKRGSWNSEGQ